MGVFCAGERYAERGSAAASAATIDQDAPAKEGALRLVRSLIPQYNKSGTAACGALSMSRTDAGTPRGDSQLSRLVARTMQTVSIPTSPVQWRLLRPPSKHPFVCVQTVRTATMLLTIDVGVEEG